MVGLRQLFEIKTASRMLWLGCLLLWCSGCGSKLPTVEGTVTLDGQPVPEARVVFESPDHPMAIGKTDDSGHYDIVTASQKGMAEGSYNIAISAYKTKEGGSESPMPILLTPKKYNSSSTSGFSAEVVSGSNTFDFELESKSR